MVNLEYGRWNGRQAGFITSPRPFRLCPKKGGEKQGSMSKRYISLWFRHLKTDWMIIRRPALSQIPFVLATPEHGRMVITSVNALAQALGITPGMVVADARVLDPTVEVIDDKPDLSAKLLKALAIWCIRYTPVTAIDLPNGLILDVTGCAHLWGGELSYLKEIVTR